MVDSGKLGKIVGHFLVQGGRLLKRTTPLLVTSSVCDEDALSLGFKCGFSDPQEAVNEAIRIKGPKSKIMLISSGGEICPIPRYDDSLRS
jgi:hypothetical protein